jgi:hypothetical protein
MKTDTATILGSTTPSTACCSFAPHGGGIEPTAVVVRLAGPSVRARGDRQPAASSLRWRHRVLIALDGSREHYVLAVLARHSTRRSGSSWLDDTVLQSTAPRLASRRPRIRDPHLRRPRVARAGAASSANRAPPRAGSRRRSRSWAHCAATLDTWSLRRGAASWSSRRACCSATRVPRARGRGRTTSAAPTSTDRAAAPPAAAHHTHSSRPATSSRSTPADPPRADTHVHEHQMMGNRHRFPRLPDAPVPVRGALAEHREVRSDGDRPNVVQVTVVGMPAHTPRHDDPMTPT